MKNIPVKPQERRRIYLIDKKFQYEFIFGFLSVLLLFTVIIYLFGGLYYYLKYQFGEAIFNDYLLIIKKGETLRVTNMFKVMIPVLSWSCVSFIVFFSIYGLFYSHKISGPIYRVKKALEAISKGKLDFKIKLRQKDKFQELSGYINNLIVSLSEKLSGIKTSSIVSVKEIKELSKIIDKADKKKIKASIKTIEKEIAKIQKGFSSIKIEQ